MTLRFLRIMPWIWWVKSLDKMLVKRIESEILSPDSTIDKTWQLPWDLRHTMTGVQCPVFQVILLMILLILITSHLVCPKAASVHFWMVT